MHFPLISIKAHLQHQWAHVVLEYGNGKYVENDIVDKQLVSTLSFSTYSLLPYSKTTGAH